MALLILNRSAGRGRAQVAPLSTALQSVRAVTMRGLIYAVGTSDGGIPRVERCEQRGREGARAALLESGVRLASPAGFCKVVPWA